MPDLADGQTVENQSIALRDLAGRRGWQIIQTYDDAGISGARDLAAFLSQHFGRAVAWALPAKPHNDIRAQFNAGEWARGLRVAFGDAASAPLSTPS